MIWPCWPGRLGALCGRTSRKPAPLAHAGAVVALERDYRNIGVMLFGEPPSFGSIIDDARGSRTGNQQVSASPAKYAKNIERSGQVTFPYTVKLDVNYTSSPVPEPSTLPLLGTGIIGLADVARRKFLPQR